MTNQRRGSDAFKNALLAVGVFALLGNMWFMWRLDSKQAQWIEHGEYRAELQQAQDSIDRLLQDQQTILAYKANIRAYWRQLLAMEEDENMRRVYQAMIDEQLALLAPIRRGSP